MNNILPDGSVLPSGFGVMDLPSAQSSKMDNKSMKVGMAIGIIYPDEDKSITKQVIEYDIAVANMDPKHGLNISVYRNCKLSDKFGAPNKYEEFTLVIGKTDGKGGFTDGSIVALECVDGVSDAGSALIVGGVSNVKDPRHKKADGEFYDFSFNGIRQYIDKDGQLTIEFSSPIAVDGSKKNEKAAGTKIKIDKDGRIKISDNENQSIEFDRVAQKATWTNSNETITVDKKNKKIDMVSSGEFSAKSSKKMNLQTDDQLNVQSKADASITSDANMKMESKGNMSQKSGGTWQVNVTGNVNIKSGANVMIEGGTIAQIKGTTTLLGEGSAPVGVAGVSISIGTGNLGAPVVSTLMTGSATVLAGT